MLKEIEILEATLAKLKAELETPTVIKPEFEAFEVYHKDLEGLFNWTEAKRACKDLGEGWRLPTKEELNEMHKKKDVVGGFANTGYWSSTEADASNAWNQYFFSGFRDSSPKHPNFNVRAVRTLTI